MTHLILLPLLLGQAEVPPPPPPSAKTGATASVAADAPTAAQPATTPSAAAPGRTVYLTINSNRPDVGLWQRGWDKPFCLAPCNAWVPAGPEDNYYLGGPGLSPSNKFTLEQGRAAKVDVRAGSRPAKIVGIIFTSVGIPVLLGGGLQMAWYGVQTNPDVQAHFAARGISGWFNPISTLVTAIVQLALGAGLLATGIPLWATNGTKMTLEEVEPPSTPAPPVEAAPATP